MVYVFSTNVDLPEQAQQLLLLLDMQYPETDFSFDLDDCDRILRAEGCNILSSQIADLLEKVGFICEPLE